MKLFIKKLNGPDLLMWLNLNPQKRKTVYSPWHYKVNLDRPVSFMISFMDSVSWIQTFFYIDWWQLHFLVNQAFLIQTTKILYILFEQEKQKQKPLLHYKPLQNHCLHSSSSILERKDCRIEQKWSQFWGWKASIISYNNFCQKSHKCK